MGDTAAQADEPVYRSPAVQSPTVKQLREIASQCDLGINDTDLQGYADVLSKWATNYTEIDALPDPVPIVKYPRTPGYRPDKDENEYNAWAYRTIIQGANQGKLKGRTVAIKDNIAVAGVPMSNGSHLLQGYMPEFDATVVTRILDAGGKIMGKSVCEDLCLCISSFSAATGHVSNPHDITRSAGGSSCGSAVLVATGAVDVALGGDQGGSIRVPAAHTGIVGLKPTFGLVPYTGACVMTVRLDTIGPMARTVHDCALLLEVLGGYDDGLDPRQFRDIHIPEYSTHLSGDLSGLTVGIMEEGFLDAEPDVAQLVRKVAYKLETLGASVKEVSVPLHLKGRIISGDIYGGYSNMIDSKDPKAQQFDIANSKWTRPGGEGNRTKGCPPGLSGFQPTSLLGAMHDGIKLRLKDTQPTVKAFVLMGEYMKRNYGHRLHCKAVNLGRVLRQAYDDALKSCDVLVLPTVLNKPKKLPSQNITLQEHMEAASFDMRNTCPINASGHPALSVCAGFSQQLPVGLMVVGRHFDDVTVLKVGHGVEKVRDGVNVEGKVSHT